MLWRTLTVLTALVALLVGTLQTSLPSTMGLYRFLTYWKPALVSKWSRSFVRYRESERASELDY